MNLTKEKAWIIFRADKLGYVEAQEAFKIMTKDQFDAYECHAEDFDFEIAKIGVEAQNEAAAIIEAHPELKYLDTLKPYNWNAMDYRNLVTSFAGSKFEKLHLSAMFRIQNNELLLELVKP
jgi:hypothetical protein